MTNIVASDFPEPWRDIAGPIPLAAAASTIAAPGTYPGLQALLGTGSASAQAGVIDFDPADYAKAGHVLKMRAIWRLITNSTGVGRDLTFDIRELQGVSGGVGANTATALGAALLAQTFPSPNPNLPGLRMVAPEIDAPIGGTYSTCLSVAGGAFAANSRIVLIPKFQVRNVPA